MLDVEGLNVDDRADDRLVLVEAGADVRVLETIMLDVEGLNDDAEDPADVDALDSAPLVEEVAEVANDPAELPGAELDTAVLVLLEGEMLVKLDVTAVEEVAKVADDPAELPGAELDIAVLALLEGEPLVKLDVTPVEVLLIDVGPEELGIDIGTDVAVLDAIIAPLVMLDAGGTTALEVDV